MTDEARKPTDKEVLEEMELDTDAGTIEEEIREEKDCDAKPSTAPKKPN
jgi:hypothetical protein